MTNANTFLRRLLYADVVISAVSAVVLIFGSAQLARWFGLPEPLLRYSGFGLIPFAALVFYVAQRSVAPRSGGVLTVIAINTLWVVASLALLFLVAPSSIGYVAVIVQAIAIAVLAQMEWVGLRRLAV